MFYTVTLNPTLDKTLAVPALVPGEIHRAETLRYDVGGKGINVARALRVLNIPAVCFGFLAGHTGSVLRESLQAQGYPCEFVEIPGETRQNITLLDRSKKEYTKLNEAGPPVTENDLHALATRIAQYIKAGDLWAFCGSLPPGAPPSTYARLIELVQQGGARAFLDTSGAPLSEGFAVRPFALKVNAEEAGGLLGRTLSSEAQVVDAVRELRREGIPWVVITRGARGVVLGTGDACVCAEPPPIETRSAVGAGDAAMAGLMWTFMEQCNAPEMARRITACGTAAATQEGTAVGDLALIQLLIPQIRVSVVRQETVPRKQRV